MNKIQSLAITGMSHLLQNIEISIRNNSYTFELRVSDIYTLTINTSMKFERHDFIVLSNMPNRFCKSLPWLCQTLFMFLFSFQAYRKISEKQRLPIRHS